MNFTLYDTDWRTLATAQPLDLIISEAMHRWGEDIVVDSYGEIRKVYCAEGKALGTILTNFEEEV